MAGCTTVDSPLHRLDPRVKIVALIAFATLSFFISSPLAGLYFAAIVIAAVLFSRTPLPVLAKTIRPFLVFLIFSFIVNTLCITGGTEYFTFGPLPITSRGIESGILVTYRALIALAFGILLVSTTTPLELTDGLERLIHPFRWFGVPTQDVAMILSVALRVIPLLSEEASRITLAQKARGAGSVEQSVLTRLKGYASLVVPLLGNSLRHAERLAIAMEARCYSANPTRSCLHPLRFEPSDALGALLAVIACAGFIVLVSATS